MKTLSQLALEDDINDVIIKLWWGNQLRNNIKISCYSYKVISKLV